MRIAVCAPQVPFVRGGAEIMADTLVAELRAREHEAELVTIPFKWYPGTRVLDQAFLWRLLDLTESDGRPIDLVRRDEVPLLLSSATRTSASGCCTSSGRPTSSTEPIWASSPKNPLTGRCGARSNVWTGIALGEAKRLFATSRNVAERIERSTGLAAEVMPHPPQELPYRNDGYGDFVLSVGRLDRAKRNDLLLEAAALDPGAPRRDRRRRPRPRRASRRSRTSAA